MFLRAAKSSTATSVSLSDWLGRLPLFLLLRGKEAHFFANFGLCGGLSGLQKCVRRGEVIQTA